MPYAEAGYAYPEAGQTLLNVTDGKIIRLLVDDQPFDVRYGQLRAHERVLDLRAGILRRRIEWASPAGQAVRVSSVRLVSFAQRAVAAILYEVEPLGTPARLVAQSELVANEPLPTAVGGDPRAGSGVGSALCSEFFSHRDARVVLVHSTRESGLRMAAAMDHVVEGPPGTQITVESGEDLGRVTVAAELEPGQRLRLVKYLGYGWSSRRSLPSVRDQVEAALAAARSTGWGGLLAAQRDYLDDFWEGADVELERAVELQQAVRFALFHTLQAGARAEGRATTGTRSGILRRSSCGPSPTPPRVLPATRSGGATPRSTSLASARRFSGSTGPLFPGAPSAARRPRGTGRPAPPPSTSTPASPTRSSATGSRAVTTRSSTMPQWSCSSRPPGSGARSATTMLAAASASTASRVPTSTAPSPTTTSTPTSWRRKTSSWRPTQQSATQTAPGGSGPARKRWQRGGTRPGPCSSPTTGRSVFTPRPRDSPSTRSGTSRTRVPSATR